MILLAIGWYLRFSLSYRDARGTPRPERGLLVDHVTVWRGGNVTPQKFSADCDRGSDRPTTVGGWMRPTSGSKVSGCIYIELLTPAVLSIDVLLSAKSDSSSG
jgi:hypothetical protein